MTGQSVTLGAHPRTVSTWVAMTAMVVTAGGAGREEVTGPPATEADGVGAEIKGALLATEAEGVG